MINEERIEDIIYTAEEYLKTTKVIVLHGCNCFHTMGGGIALYLRNKYPVIADKDKETKFNDRSKLGTFSYAQINSKLIIANCYTQFKYGWDKVHVDSDAIYKCIKSICETFPDYYIILPQIGCGLAGGDWKEIKKVINNALGDRLATVCSI